MPLKSEQLGDQFCQDDSAWGLNNMSSQAKQNTCKESVWKAISGPPMLIEDDALEIWESFDDAIPQVEPVSSTLAFFGCSNS